MKSRIGCIVVSAVFAMNGLAQTGEYPFRNPDLPLEVRIQDLTSRLTLEEKVAFMKFEYEAIPRLGIPAYNWWNEALHGTYRREGNSFSAGYRHGGHLRCGCASEDGRYDCLRRSCYFQ